MLAKNILHQTSPARNAEPKAPYAQHTLRNGHNGKLRVKTTVDTRTTISNFILPKGAIGTVLDYQFNGTAVNNLVIDFGFAPVIVLPPDSQLIEVIGEAL